MMSRGMVSLKQIAEKASVSITTVSRVMRNTGEISDETRQRVLRVAEELRYRPNLPAQSIHSGRTSTIGVIMPAAGGFDMRIMMGIHNELAEHGYVPITLWSGADLSSNSDNELLAQVHNLLDHRVDGVILRPTVDAREGYLQEVLDREIPLVMVDRDLSDISADFVGTDDEFGGRLVAEYLISLGHRHIAHLAGSEKTSSARLRRKGFEEAVSDRPDVQWQTLADPGFGVDLKMDMEIAMKLLATDIQATAVFAANDVMANSIYNAARRLGLRVPQDISVVGFADMEISEMMDPPLTTVRQHPDEMGAHAARLVLKRVSAQENNGKPRRILLKPELIHRDSVIRFE